ncbi:helix-turn-helix domain-containing protein [Paraburkholderia sp. BR10882]|uniref:helix-turn-helix domain-containing protein n=1 Tax=unclassified Paraburkholderia TaxID=2615204 RepID=UPI0034CF35B7
MKYLERTRKSTKKLFGPAALRRAIDAGCVANVWQTLFETRLIAPGLTDVEYGQGARKIKLDQVSERLIMTSAPATTISAELGLSSDSGMRRMFKELTALTPSQYRQMFGRN